MLECSFFIAGELTLKRVPFANEPFYVSKKFVSILSKQKELVQTFETVDQLKAYTK